MRTAAQQKLGFYPISPEVLPLIKGYLTFSIEPDGLSRVTILDPCAGQGSALNDLAFALKVPRPRTFAVELDEGRGEKVRTLLPDARVLSPADFKAVAMSPGCVSLAYVNPPYDDELGGGRRDELSFLVKTTQLLKHGGILVAVLPESTIKNTDVGRHIESWYEDAQVFKLPEKQRKFSECVVIARRRRSFILPLNHPQSFLAKQWDSWQWPRLGAGGSTWHVPAGDLPRRFEKIGFTEPELIAALNASPIPAAVFGEPNETEARQPGLPPRHGHIVTTLVSGRLDGVVRKAGEPPHVIRGTARKVPYRAEDEDILDDKGNVTGHRTVIKEEPVLTIRAVGPDFEKIYDFSSATKETQSSVASS